MLPTWIEIIQELKHVNTQYDEVHRQFMVTTKYITSYIKLTITLDLKHCQYNDANIPMGSYFMTKIHINHQVQLQRYLKGTNTKIQEK